MQEHAADEIPASRYKQVDMARFTTGEAPPLLRACLWQLERCPARLYGRPSRPAIPGCQLGLLGKTAEMMALDAVLSPLASLPVACASYTQPPSGRRRTYPCIISKVPPTPGITDGGLVLSCPLRRTLPLRAHRESPPPSRTQLHAGSASM